MKKTICLYVCKKHFIQSLMKIQFGEAIDEILPTNAGPCNYCKGNSIARLFVYENHWLVNEFLEEVKK